MNIYVYHLMCCEHLIMVLKLRKFLLYDVNLLTMGYGANFKSIFPSSGVLINIQWGSHQHPVGFSSTSLRFSSKRVHELYGP